MTYEDTLNRMLDRVSDSMDKREGAIIRDVLSPMAVEEQSLMIQKETVMNETFPDTATREYLIKRAKERGIKPKPASYAILKGEFNMDVEIGSRFNCGELNYVTIEKIENGKFKMQCESLGVIGNKNFGQMIPIDYIEGLETAELTELLIPAEDEEDTELFRERYLNSFDAQAFGGNVADYIEKTKSLNGVGGVKVYRAWNGGGTVKLVIIDSTYSKPSETLVNGVQTAADPLQNQGDGLGFAPIGHVVTVVGVEETTVNIDTTITFQEGWNFAAVEPYVQDAIDDYFNELASEWEDNENLIVRISGIETKLLAVTGILDIADTTLNGESSNLTIPADNIPVRGSVANV